MSNEYTATFHIVQYTATLRLPDKLPNDLKMDRLNEIVDVLELRKCFKTSEEQSIHDSII